MRTMTRALFATVAVAALALTGCTSGGAGSQSGQTKGSADTGDEQLTPRSSVNVQERKSIEEGGDLHMAISALPITYNVRNVLGNTVDLAKTIGPFVQPSNFIYSDDGTFVVNPNFLKDFSVEHADGEEPQVVTLTLAEEAVWGDGTPITWEDYEATWKACNGQQSAPSSEDASEGEEGDEGGSGDVFLCASKDGWDYVKSVEAGATDHEVVVTYHEAYPDWSATLASVAPKAGVASPELFNEGWSTPNNDWFAGPYQFASVDEAQKLITLEKNPAWWGNEGMLDSITFKVMDPSQMADAFANGDIDVLTDIVDADQYLAAETRADGEVRHALATQWRQFTFNGEAENLGSKEVRQAIVMGIDREKIVEADMAGIPNISTKELVLGNHFFMPGQQGYKNNGLDYAYDPERAKEALEDAGWVLEEGADYRTKDGKTLEFDYRVIQSFPTSRNEGEELKEQMEALGVKVNFVDVEADVFFEEVAEGNFGLVSFAWEGGPYPMANISQIYSCEEVAPDGQNYSRICDERIDELSAAVAEEINEEERLKLANEADETIWENAMVLPLYQRVDLTAVPKSLANYGAFGMSSVIPENVGFLKK